MFCFGSLVSVSVSSSVSASTLISILIWSELGGTGKRSRFFILWMLRQIGVIKSFWERVSKTDLHMKISHVAVSLAQSFGDTALVSLWCSARWYTTCCLGNFDGLRQAGYLDRSRSRSTVHSSPSISLALSQNDLDRQKIRERAAREYWVAGRAR